MDSKLDVQYVRPGDLRPRARNPRTHSLSVANSHQYALLRIMPPHTGWRALGPLISSVRARMNKLPRHPQVT